MGRKVVLSSQHCLMKLKKMKSEKPQPSTGHTVSAGLMLAAADLCGLEEQGSKRPPPTDLHGWGGGGQAVMHL